MHVFQKDEPYYSFLTLLRFLFIISVMTLEDESRPFDPDFIPQTLAEYRESLTPSQEALIRRLYDESLKWLTDEKGARLIAEFSEANLAQWGQRIPANLLGEEFPSGIVDGEDRVFPEIPIWDSLSGRPPASITVPLHLEKGAILEDDQFEYGISLGRRHFDRNSDPVLSFQFGSFRLGEGLDDIEPTQLLHMLVDRSHYQSMAGEFTTDPYMRRIDVRSWADDMRLGGYGLRHWKQSELLAEEGFATSLELVQNTFSRPFTRASKTSA